MSKYPQYYPQLNAYRTFIQGADAKYHWYAVASYDCQYRQTRAAIGKPFDLEEVDTNLFVTTMDATTVKSRIGAKAINTQRGCFRCQSKFHVVRDCPFRETQTQLQTPAHSQEICNNFQNDRCFNSSCKRRHVCASCGGSYPRGRCPACYRTNTDGRASTVGGGNAYPQRQ